MGEHGLYMKNVLYEPAHRVSLLMRLPSAIRAGTVVRECVGSVDVMPTVLGLLGLQSPAGVQGHDASPLLRADHASWKNEAFLHHSSLDHAGIFTPEWQLILSKNAPPSLFDRRNDPEQVHDLGAGTAHQAVVQELKQRVIAHNREVNAPAAKWLG